MVRESEKKARRHKNIIFLVAFLFAIITFAVTYILKSAFVADFLFETIAVVIFYVVERKYPAPIHAIIVGFLPILLSFGGVFGLFGVTLFGIGYDKYAHFFFAFCASYLLYFMLTARKRTHRILKMIAVVLIIIGLGAINEINEFVGSAYLHQNNAGMFSMGDELPPSTADLQRYDTQWDMIFNTFGSVSAILLVAVADRIRQQKVKK